MSTPRKSTSHTAIPSTPRRPCTPESAHGRSPRARLSRSPDRHMTSSPDRPTKSYLRPTVSSTLHHGSSTNQPRKSIDKPPFLPPSSVGINSQHHKNPSSSGKGSLTLKGILTRATNAMKVGPDKRRMSGASAGINIGKGSGSSTPVRPRSPANLPKKEGSRNFARSNSVPKKLGVVKKDKERDNMSICSIEDKLPEHLPDPVEITPEASKNATLSTAPHVELQEPIYTEKEENVHEEVIQNSIVATEGKQIEENHKEAKVEEIDEGPKEVEEVKVIEECRDEQPMVEEEVKETPKETENAILGEKQEEETPKAETVNVVEIQAAEYVLTVEEREMKTPEGELQKELEEISILIAAEEENKEEPKQPEEKEVIIADNHEAPKEEIETQNRNEEEKPAAKLETKVEETPKAEENGIVAETPKVEENVKETPKVEEKPTEEGVVETPKVEEKPVDTTVAEPKKDNATSKKPDAVATRREGAISNDVIEETKSKLMEKRKNKVLALVGAFETVMQKPEEGSTRR